MSDTYDTDAKHMRHSLPKEQEAYERMLERMNTPLMQEQEHMRRTTRLMLHMGRLKEQNEQLRELVEYMWLIRHNDPMSFEWIRVREKARNLGIRLE